MTYDDVNSIFDDPYTYMLKRQQQQQQEAADANKTALAQPLQPGEQDTLLKKMMGTAGSGLAFAGSTLGKLFGGRAIRAGLMGAAGGPMNWRELASIIPGSDITGLTNPDEATTGRQLTDQLKLTTPDAQHEEGFLSPQNLAGMGVDILTDPATYLTFGAGAINKAGALAQKAGVLPTTTAGRIAGLATPEAVATKMGLGTLANPDVAAAGAELGKAGLTMADVTGKPLGGLFGLRLPFTTAHETGAIFGTGPTAQKVAETIGKPFQWLANTKPAAYLAAQFNPAYEGVTDPLAQTKMLAEAPFKTRRTQDLQRGLAEAYDPILQLGEIPQQHNALARSALENVPDFHGPLSPEIYDAYAQAAAKANALKDQYANMFREAGGNLGEWGSIFDTGHAFRAPTPLDVTSPVWRGRGARENLSRQFYSGVGPAIQRENFLDLPRGTNQINELVADPMLGTQARTIPVGGQDVTWLSGDAARAKDLNVRLTSAMQAFGPAEQEELMTLRAMMGQGPLNAADQARYDLLRRGYLQSRGNVRDIVRTDVLGGYDPNDLRLLSRRQAAGQTLSPQELDELDRLRELSGANRYAAGKVARLYQTRVPQPGEYGNPAGRIVPGLQQALQDRAAANYLRKTTFGVDPERLSQLQAASGVDDAGMSAILKAQAPDREAAVTALTTPGQAGGNALTGGQVLTADEAKELIQTAHLDRISRPLARWLGGLDPARQEMGGLFQNDPFVDLLSYGRQMVKGTSNAQIVHDLIADSAVGGGTQSGAKSVVPLLDELRLDTPKSRELIRQQLRDRGILFGGAGAQAGDLAQAAVPDDVANAIMQLAPRGRTPEYAAGPLRVADAATQLTRMGITVPWPAFHVRNLTTDELNAVQRLGNFGAAEWGPAAQALAQGKNPEALLNLPMVRAAGITDPVEAARLVGREAYATSAFGRGIGRLGGDVFDPGKHPIFKAIPGGVPSPSLADIATGKTLPADWTMRNPTAIEGFMGQTESRFAPAVVGRGLANWEDTTARGGMWLHLLDQGYTPAAAADLMNKTIYGGAQFTPFEKNVMRRLVPFWGYTKFAGPQQAEFLATHPGGLAAQGIRAAAASRDQGFLPDYLADQLAIPLGGTDESGQRRFLTRLDFPWESPLNMLKPGRSLSDTISQTGMGVLSQLNPLIKGPLEVATNRQFYTGRELDELNRSITGVPAIDNLIYNSPASRTLTTLGTLQDLPRKGLLGEALNLGTGARVSDVDWQKVQSQAALQAVKDYLQADPSVAKYMEFAPQKGVQLTPDEVNVMRLLKSLEANASKEAKARKKAGG